jgi:RND family efflux transporter MFP subunit
MKLAHIGRLSLTLILVVVALVAIGYLWNHYKVEPWTRDGRVRAEVVQVAPDVSGLITDVRVHDNQSVRKGDVLFIIDRARFQLAVQQADSAAAGLRVQLDQVRRENGRDNTLGNLVSAEVKEQSRSKIAQLQASLAQAEAALALARLNLERSEVKAAVDGMVTNLDLHAGDYATAGRPLLALIDQASLHVVGYFEETKIAKFRIGDPAVVRLMGDDHVITGHVESIAGGIEDRDRGASTKLLANVNPSFNWIRLSQRIPVRIALDRRPEDVSLIAGRTASVEILPALVTAARGDKS